MYIYTDARTLGGARTPATKVGVRTGWFYTRSPLEDSPLFGPSPWKILATTYEKKDY